jgi:protein farnesyltransferase/geranylgeranyltransferase type-1 subunit alpha
LLRQRLGQKKNMSALSLTVKELESVFHDLTPIPQDDGPSAVGRIDYPEEFETAYNYFRAVVAADERSVRSLPLTALCLDLNPANYTVWHFRRLVLTTLGYDCLEANLVAELDLAARLGGENPKNYQIWYHRRALLERLQANSEKQDMLMAFFQHELDYTATVFCSDSKNYHSWSYRQWVVQACNSPTVWEQEMVYADTLILLDVRNNSAWNQRWFACHRGQLQQALSRSVFEAEADYALTSARLDPYNESPWRYFIAVLREQLKHDPSIGLDLHDYQLKAEGVKQILVDAGRDPDSCANLQSAIIDILEWIGSNESLQHAMELSLQLAREFDPIREKYWQFRCQQLEAAMVKFDEVKAGI